jgi:hypothetical protein
MPAPHQALYAPSVCRSYQEQMDVEWYFLEMGVLLPEFHKAYWLGLQVPEFDINRIWPYFVWSDGSPPPSTATNPSENYQHWGRMYLAGGKFKDEPNNLAAPEYCGVANYTQMVEDVWSWSDQNCEDRYMFICKLPAPPPPSPSPSPPAPPPPAPPVNMVYASSKQRMTYYFNATKLNFVAASVACKSMGLNGNLVTYGSLAAQVEVEQVVLARSAFRDRFYWIGLRVGPFDRWPTFSWLSNGLSLNRTRYHHWGMFKPGTHVEPNNVFVPENCAGANLTQAYDSAWGWSDNNCNMLAPFICEVPFAEPPPPSPSPPATDAFSFQTAALSSATRGAMYSLSTVQLDWPNAAAACSAAGSALVVYTWVSGRWRCCTGCAALAVLRWLCCMSQAAPEPWGSRAAVPDRDRVVRSVRPCQLAHCAARLQMSPGQQCFDVTCMVGVLHTVTRKPRINMQPCASTGCQELTLEYCIGYAAGRSRSRSRWRRTTGTQACSLEATTFTGWACASALRCSKTGPSLLGWLAVSGRHQLLVCSFTAHCASGKRTRRQPGAGRGCI